MFKTRHQLTDSIKEFILGKSQWWQWPTVLSLDAPAVSF
jgi:hypothetical protein